jgi:transposase
MRDVSKVNKAAVVAVKAKRRVYTDEFRQEAVRMLGDGHSAASVAERLGLSSVGILYLWKKRFVHQAGAPVGSLEERLRHLEAELRRAERERDILKKALAIFGRQE